MTATDFQTVLNDLGNACGAVKDDAGNCTAEAVTDGIYDWRGRCYYAEKWLSRLLGIGLNQVVDEAERRIDHPLGHPEPWTGPAGSWEQANLTRTGATLSTRRGPTSLLGSTPRSGSRR